MQFTRCGEQVSWCVPFSFAIIAFPLFSLLQPHGSASLCWRNPNNLHEMNVPSYRICQDCSSCSLTLSTLLGGVVRDNYVQTMCNEIIDSSPLFNVPLHMHVSPVMQISRFSTAQQAGMAGCSRSPTAGGCLWTQYSLRNRSKSHSHS